LSRDLLTAIFCNYGTNRDCEYNIVGGGVFYSYANCPATIVSPFCPLQDAAPVPNPFQELGCQYTNYNEDCLYSGAGNLLGHPHDDDGQCPANAVGILPVP
jgi:hypothetical protein